MLLKRDTQVLVVGAGPVGLLAALDLARRGVKVAVVDEQQRTAARTYACALHPRSLGLLEEAGVARHLIPRGSRIDSVAFYEGAERRGEASYAKLGGAHSFLLVVPQQTLEDALEARLKAEGVPVLWGHRVGRLLDDGAAAVRLERLERASSGYAVQTTEWVVQKEEEVRVPFAVGADGHRSQVRRGLSIDLPAAGPTQVFAVWEFAGHGPALKEARVGLTGGKASILWPLGQGWWRFGFEVGADEPVEARREKSRQVALAGDAAWEQLDRERLTELIAERAPWFEGAGEEVAWAMAIRFERRLAASFGRGSAWLVGDAAHLAPPVSVQSMNVGMFEAARLAAEIEAVLRQGAARGRLDAWARARREEFEKLLAGTPTPRPGAQAFARDNARLVADCLPASGEDRARMIEQLGLEAT